MWSLKVEVRTVPGLPLATGTHELAWGLILDRIFADAFHTGLGALYCTLPLPELEDAVRLRAELTAPRPGAWGAGVALLAGVRGPWPDGPERLYTLEAAPPAPGALRVALPRLTAPPGWRMEDAVGLYGWQPWLLGAPVRAARMLRLPRWADRTMCAVRAGFEQRGAAPATYRLKVWRPV